MSDLPEYPDHLGEVRKLGWVPPSEDGLKMRAATTSIQALRAANNLPPLKLADIVSQGIEKDFISPLGRRCVNNQRSSGGCTGWSAAQASTRLRLMRGQAFQKLSGAAIYAQINGGRDNGSNIIDSQNAIEINGTCLESEMDWPKIYSNQIPPGVLRFKEDPQTKVTLTTFEDACVALAMNMIPQFPLCATNRWTSNTGFDVNGVADLSRSTRSNHSVHGAGLVILSGVPYIIVPNSWALTWGPFVNQNPTWYAPFIARNGITPLDSLPLAGCCLISQGHIDNCDQTDDAYAHAVSSNAPSDTDAPGAVA